MAPKIYDIYEEKLYANERESYQFLGGRNGEFYYRRVFFFCGKMTQQLRNVQSERIFCHIMPAVL